MCAREPATSVAVYIGPIAQHSSNSTRVSKLVNDTFVLPNKTANTSKNIFFYGKIQEYIQDNEIIEIRK